MKLLDLFCGAGGAAMGYHRVGFEVFGVDIKPQPHYPFPFYQADVLELPLAGFDAIHASPPCQRWSASRRLHPVQAGDLATVRDYPDLLTPIRERLQAAGVPWVIENVPGAPMRADFMLCGSHFDLGVRRHRLFETNWALPQVGRRCDHSRRVVTVHGHGAGSRKYRTRPDWGTVAEWRVAMGIDWMARDELTQAVPPAYTEFVGWQLMTALLDRKEGEAAG